MSRALALIDGNSFYCSCERVFDPKLRACNRRFGRGTVVPGAAGFAPRRAWSTKFEMRSPRYTTRLDELPVIRAA